MSNNTPTKNIGRGLTYPMLYTVHEPGMLKDTPSDERQVDSHTDLIDAWKRAWAYTDPNMFVLDQKVPSPSPIWESILNGPGKQEVTLDPTYGNPYSAARVEDIKAMLKDTVKDAYMQEKDDFSNRVNYYMSNRRASARLDAALIDQVDNFMESLNSRVSNISKRDKKTMCPAGLSLSVLLLDPATAMQESYTPSSMPTKLTENALAREAYKQGNKSLAEPSVDRQAAPQRSSASDSLTVSWPSIQTYADLRNQGTDGPYHVLDATADGVEEGVSALYTWIVPDGCLDRQGYWKRICCFVGLNHKVVPADYCRKKPDDPYQVKAFIDTYVG